MLNSLSPVGVKPVINRSENNTSAPSFKANLHLPNLSQVNFSIGKKRSKPTSEHLKAITNIIRKMIPMLDAKQSGVPNSEEIITIIRRLDNPKKSVQSDKFIKGVQHCEIELRFVPGENGYAIGMEPYSKIIKTSDKSFGKKIKNTLESYKKNFNTQNEIVKKFRDLERKLTSQFSVFSLGMNKLQFVEWFNKEGRGFIKRGNQTGSTRAEAILEKMGSLNDKYKGIIPKGDKYIPILDGKNSGWRYSPGPASSKLGHEPIDLPCDDIETALGFIEQRLQSQLSPDNVKILFKNNKCK